MKIKITANIVKKSKCTILHLIRRAGGRWIDLYQPFASILALRFLLTKNTLIMACKKTTKKTKTGKSGGCK